MNVLFLGPYRQRDGWGDAAKEYLRALDKTSHDISSRPIYMNTDRAFDNDELFDQCEQRSLEKKNYDAVIYNCLPDMMTYRAGVKNIGLAYFETINLNHLPWINSLNIMDELWVTSDWERLNLVNSGVKTPIKIVPIPTDVSKFDKTYDFSEIPKIHRSSFLFYTVAEYTTRKNILSLVTAFHNEFDRSEPVDLVLKVNRVGVSSINLYHAIDTDIQRLKNTLGLYKSPHLYKKEMIICNRLPLDELYGLHNVCDCFVMPSRGEAFCKPAFDALGFGKTPIINGNTSMAEFVTNRSNGFYVSSMKQPAIAQDRPVSFLYTGRDEWFDIQLSSLQSAMRSAFELPNDVRDSMKANGRKAVGRYSYDNIAKKIEEIL